MVYNDLLHKLLPRDDDHNCECPFLYGPLGLHGFANKDLGAFFPPMPIRSSQVVSEVCRRLTFFFSLTAGEDLAVSGSSGFLYFCSCFCPENGYQIDPALICQLFNWFCFFTLMVVESTVGKDCFQGSFVSLLCDFTWW